MYKRRKYIFFFIILFLTPFFSFAASPQDQKNSLLNRLEEIYAPLYEESVSALYTIANIGLQTNAVFNNGLTLLSQFYETSSQGALFDTANAFDSVEKTDIPLFADTFSIYKNIGNNFLGGIAISAGKVASVPRAIAEISLPRVSSPNLSFAGVGEVWYVIIDKLSDPLVPLFEEQTTAPYVPSSSSQSNETATNSSEDKASSSVDTKAPTSTPQSVSLYTPSASMPTIILDTSAKANDISQTDFYNALAALREEFLSINSATYKTLSGFRSSQSDSIARAVGNSITNITNNVTNNNVDIKNISDASISNSTITDGSATGLSDVTTASSTLGTAAADSLAVTGNITAGAFYGDGSHLTGISSGSSFSTSTTRGVFDATSSLSYDSSTGIFGVASGYAIPLIASTTNWNNFFNTPSTAITAGTGLTWSGNTINNTGVTSIGGLTGDVSTSSLGFVTSTTTIVGTANQISTSVVGNTVTLSIPSSPHLPGTLFIGGGQSLQWGDNGSAGTITGFLSNSSDGVFRFGDSSGGGSPRIILGSAGSTYVSLLRDGAGLDVRLGDNSNYASTTAANFNGVGNIASFFRYASTTALSVSGVNGLTVGSLTGPLQAVNGVVSATSTLSAAYGGTGVSSLPSYGQVLVGNNSGGYTLTSTSSLGISSGGSSPFTDSGGSVYYNSGENVGIGTTSPDSLLTVAGNINLTGALKANYSAGTNGQVLQTTGTGVQWVSTSTLGISGGSSPFTDSGSYVYYNGGENVGIGVTNPTVKTYIYNSATSSGEVLRVGVNWSSTNDYTGIGLGSDGTISVRGIAEAAGGRGFGIYNGTTNTMRILNNGNVGIGDSNPANKLVVNGNMNVLGTNMDSNTATPTFNVNGAFMTIGDYVSSQSFPNGIGIKFNDTGSAHASLKYTSSTDRFDFCSSGGNSALTCSNTSILTLLNVNGGGSGQEVGVGTSSPDSRLTIAGNVNITGALKANYNAGTNGQVLQTTGSGIQWVATSTLGLSSQWTTSGSTIYYNSGSVGIGTVSPGQKFSVSSGSIGLDGGYGIYFNSTDPNWRFGRNLVTTSGAMITTAALQALVFGASDQGFQVVNGTNNTAVFEVGGTGIAHFVGNVGIGTTSPATKLDVNGDITTETVTSCSGLQTDSTGKITCTPSDENVKQDITSLDSTSGISLIENLNPVSFQYKNSALAQGTQYGFLAQDVAKVLPGLVSTSSMVTPWTPNGTLNLNYQGLIAPVVEAVKEIISLSDEFKDKLVAWFGSSANGIHDLFVGTSHQETLCVGDSASGETCVSKTELDNLLRNAGQTVTVYKQDAGTTTESSVDESTTTVSDVTASSTIDDTSTSTSSIATSTPDKQIIQTDTSGTTNTATSSSDTISSSADASTTPAN